MQIFRYAEQGSIGLLWISATNPAVSLPELGRIRRILAKPEPVRRGAGPVPHRDRASSPTSCSRRAAGARRPAPSPTPTGPCTCPRRPSSRPGEARSDLDIFLDYARRMDFRDTRRRSRCWTGRTRRTRSRRGRSAAAAAVRLHRPSATTSCAAAAASSGRATTDAPGRHRAALRGRPCSPPTPDYCEDYGHDLAHRRDDRARPSTGRCDPAGAPILKAAEYTPPHEEPDDEYPLLFTTGRTAYHFHTRTKTGRAPQLNGAAPGAWVEISAEDAGRLGIAEGDMVGCTSPRGRIEAPARIGGVREGTRLRAVPLRLLGSPDGAADGGTDGRERADHHRMGSGVQAAAVQDGRRAGVERWRSGR